jgi:outer membrane protein assembly factor BamB
MAQPVYVGIKGRVICLDGSNGQVRWLAELKGSDFVNVLFDGDRVIATTRGEVFCLDATNGKLIWHNELHGQGLGLVTIATPTAAASSAPLAEKRRQDAAAAAAASSSAAG